MNDLELRYDQVGGQVSLKPVLHRTGGERVDWSAHPNFRRTEELHTLAAEMTAALDLARQALGDSGTDADFTSIRGHIENELQPLGRRLREALLPTAVLDELQRDTSITHLTFHCDPSLNYVPFESVFLWDDFACFKYATGKRLVSTNLRQPSSRKPLLPHTAGGVIDPGDQLDPTIRAAYHQFQRDWANQGNEKRIEFSKTTPPGRVEPEQVAVLFQGSEFVNLVCHHRYKAGFSHKTGLLLESDAGNPDAQLFSAEDMLKSLAPGNLSPLLVFSVSCESGITLGWEHDWPATQQLHGMVDVALRTGIRHYIGTITQIPEQRSTRVFAPFYGALVRGHTVGESLRRARLALRANAQDPLDGGTLLGLAYVLYGDPTRAYFCAEGHRIDSASSVLCDAPVEGRECGKAVCGQDSGYAEMRCREHSPASLTCSANHAVRSLDELQPCVGPGCRATVCAECRGFNNRVCRGHSCYEGHSIIEIPTKLCPDRKGRHPGEKRVVCPLDPGWIRGLCSLCLD